MNKVVVIRIRDRPLPDAIASSDDFLRLDEPQQKAFAARLRYIEEIPVKLDDWIGCSVTPDNIKSFIDRIELDLMINLGTPGAAEKCVSPWLLHSSWTFDTSSRAMRRALGDAFLAELALPLPGLFCSLIEFGEWLSRLRANLMRSLDAFYDSKSFDSAMAHLIAVDVSLSQMYSGFIAQRLNPHIIDA